MNALKSECTFQINLCERTCMHLQSSLPHKRSQPRTVRSALFDARHALALEGTCLGMQLRTVREVELVPRLCCNILLVLSTHLSTRRADVLILSKCTILYEVPSPIVPALFGRTWKPKHRNYARGRNYLVRGIDVVYTTFTDARMLLIRVNAAQVVNKQTKLQVLSCVSQVSTHAAQRALELASLVLKGKKSWVLNNLFCLHAIQQAFYSILIGQTLKCTAWCMQQELWIFFIAVLLKRLKTSNYELVQVLLTKVRLKSMFVV